MSAIFIKGFVGVSTRSARVVGRNAFSAIDGSEQSMKLAVIGEHVDSFATLSALRHCGVEYAQGHWLGAPRRLAGLDLAALLPR